MFSNMRTWLLCIVGLALFEMTAAVNETRIYKNEMKLILTDQTLENCIHMEYNLTAIKEEIHVVANRSIDDHPNAAVIKARIQSAVSAYFQGIENQINQGDCHRSGSRFWHYINYDDMFAPPLRDFKIAVHNYNGLKTLIAYVQFHNNLLTQFSRRRAPFGFGAQFLHDGLLMSETRMEPLLCNLQRLTLRICATDIQMDKVRSLFVHHDTQKQVEDDTERNPWLPIPYYRGLYHLARINESLMFVRLERCSTLGSGRLSKCNRPPAGYDSIPFPLDRCHFAPLDEDNKCSVSCKVGLGGETTAVIVSEHKWPVEGENENILELVLEDLFELQMRRFVKVPDMPKVPEFKLENRTLIEDIAEAEKRHESEPIVSPSEASRQTEPTVQLILEAILVLSMAFNLTFCAMIWCLRRRAPVRRDPNNSFVNCNYYD